MMPIIQPIRIQCVPPTEYQKEQKAFAKMEVEFRACNRAMNRQSWSRQSWCRRFWIFNLVRDHLLRHRFMPTTHIRKPSP